ncbi:MAG: elongation factor Ts [Candidatus Phytoplasma pruni]|uniref:translation elongation factor Ts n=1 Tax=Poinsettia branch-inducing phytoplasma TaxID=138647 RepID=UPI00037A8B86|nr:translation elongation factor Ts [Poinsettia branch-inducing phytoplasma]WEK82664.1 MAG: elongation factor Ts [Candidatus Phytoplasma pruni]
MKITLEMIKELRKKTQSGMMNCKQALEHTQGNMDKAVAYLKEKGMITANKKKDKVSAEGLTNVAFKGNKAVLFELNSETDFVAKNEHFIALLEQLKNSLLDADASVKTVEDFLNYHWNGQRVKNIILDKAAIIKEQIVLKRIQTVYKKDNESFGLYKHQGGKISALVHFDKQNKEAQTHIPIHVAGFNPKFLSKEAVDPNFIKTEKQLFLEKTINEKAKQNLPSGLLDKIASDRLNKVLEEICLLEQPFYNDTDQKVKEFLQVNQTNVIAYYRFEVGETAEKNEQ